VLAEARGRPGGLFLLGLPLALIEAGLRPGWPGGQFDLLHDWAALCLFFACFVMGCVLQEDERFLASVDRNGKITLALAVLGMGLFFALSLSTVVKPPAATDPTPYTVSWVLFQFLRGMNSWFWCLAFLSMGRRCLRSENCLLAYLRPASYPLYIIHAPVVMLIAYHVVRWPFGPLSKFALILSGAYPATFIIYDLFIRRSQPTRILFGMRRKDG
jgi:hypothetical protein